MLEDENAVLLTAGIIHAELKKLPGETPIKDVVKAAFVASHTEDTAWMLSTDDGRFRAGVGGLLLRYKGDDEMTERITHELNLVRALGAATQGVPVNFEALSNEDIQPIGLMKVYREVAKEARP